MQKKISLQLQPAEAEDSNLLKHLIASSSGVKLHDVCGYHLLKKSIDARAKKIWVNLTLNAFINEPFHERSLIPFIFKDVSRAKKSVAIVGAGPAGLFAALTLLQQGVKPILIERGKDVKARRRDLAALNKSGVINPESNYCFGEGGAGTYSDGKLYTRSNKRGSIDRILHLFVHFGAEEKIIYEAHPHIGTNKLPQIITAMREQILNHGGEIHFEKKVVDIVVTNQKVERLITSDEDVVKADYYILATGHSARDIFTLLEKRNVLIEAKPFALGVRVEHPQEMINEIQYHLDKQDQFLPPASYSLVHQVEDRGVFSFCMCPGGIIAPAATNAGELVVNGWSPSKRNNPYANSGMVVQVEKEDVIKYFLKQNIKYNEESALLIMNFQAEIEQHCFKAGGGKFIAPAQRLVDFTNNQTSSSLPRCSYIPGVSSVNLNEVLPGLISNRLRKAFKIFGKKLHGKNSWLTNEAIVVATESRTSSPVKIPRLDKTLTHPQLDNLYPCGEGAGYAGGIVSAAMDGERVAFEIVKKINTITS